MISFVDLPTVSLDDYAGVSHLTHSVRELRDEARELQGIFDGRTVFMVNSTAAGGGVAEMMPALAGILNDLGVKTRWAVINTEENAFFELTKRLHNLIHGADRPHPDANDRQVFEKVNRENYESLAQHVKPDDVVVVHDPQPMPLGPMLVKDKGVKTVWRCHIGLDDTTPATEAAWGFLGDYAEPYTRAVFTAPEYIPEYFTRAATILPPAIDPLAHKNREVDPHKLVGVLVNSGLLRAAHPVVTPDWDERAMRLGTDGTFRPATDAGDLGLLYRPFVTQVSRWDRLKGWQPLIQAFAQLKRKLRDYASDPVEVRRLNIARLALVGPDPSSIQDDPEGKEVLEQLKSSYRALEPEIQQDIALLSLPMGSRKYNHLMVNALQRCATVVVQNSIQEGFGLTVSEAMWKRRPVLGSRACGIRQQVRDNLDGRLVDDPEDVDQLAAILAEMLAHPKERAEWGARGQRRVHDEFLVFTQVRRWLRVLSEVLTE